MIARLAAALLVLSAALALAPTASAAFVAVGDCSKAGACAAVCTGDDCPGYDNLLCAGVSYQVPQCVHDPTTSTLDSSAARCMGLPCDIINAVCYTATKQWCVG